MIRKLLGILVLLLVAIAGVVYVEMTAGPAHTANADAHAENLYRVVLGGADTPAIAASTDGETGRDEDSSPAIPAPERPVARLPRDPPTEFHYSVRDGDSLLSIARDFLGADGHDVVDRIAQDNALKNANALRVGQALVIRVARCDRHVATGKETWRDLARRFYASPDRVRPLYHANQVSDPPNDPRPTAGTLVWIPH